MKYQVVFDIANKPSYWWFPASGLFIALIAIIMLISLKLRRIKPRLWQSQKMSMVISAIIAFFSLVLSCSSGIVLYSRQANIQALLSQQQVVEGRVEYFTPMPYEGKALESFSVRGVKFEYSDFVLTSGFNNTASHGGPIQEGLQVRIHYVDNIILKLEIQMP